MYSMIFPWYVRANILYFIKTLLLVKQFFDKFRRCYFSFFAFLFPFNIFLFIHCHLLFNFFFLALLYFILYYFIFISEHFLILYFIIYIRTFPNIISVYCPFLFCFCCIFAIISICNSVYFLFICSTLNFSIT